MSHQSLKSLVSYLVDISIISQDKQSAVCNFVQKRLVKRGVTSVSYEISDTQSILFSRDAITGLYSVEILTAAIESQVVQPVESQVVIPSEPVQFALNLHYEIDLVKAAAYFKQHKKPRKLKLVDNTPSPQLTFNFDSPVKKNNVVPFNAVPKGKVAQMRNVA